MMPRFRAVRARKAACSRTFAVPWPDPAIGPAAPCQARDATGIAPSSDPRTQSRTPSMAESLGRETKTHDEGCHNRTLPGYAPCASIRFLPRFLIVGTRGPAMNTGGAPSFVSISASPPLSPGSMPKYRAILNPFLGMFGVQNRKDRALIGGVPRCGGDPVKVSDPTGERQGGEERRIL